CARAMGTAYLYYFDSW
nr:immunoglobulin heavy chain junction region [Macaca mulatta]MOW84848.1 immunoglobulin heavy chain junction region [Macaca mulatta]